MQRMIVGIVSGIAILLSILWFFKEGGFEPAVSSLAGIAGILSSLFGSKDSPAGAASQHPGTINALINDVETGRFNSMAEPAARPVSGKKKTVDADAYHLILKKELHELIERVDATYYDLYEKLLSNKYLFKANPNTAERWRLEALSKMAFAHIFVLCGEQIKMRNTIGASNDFRPVWNIEPDPAGLVRNLIASVHALIRGDTAHFDRYLDHLGIQKSYIEKMIGFSRISAKNLFKIDSKMNEKKRKIMENLINLKAAADTASERSRQSLVTKII